MATQNIQNTTTGELGYQVPGATLASGWQPYSAPVATTVPSGQTSTTQAPATPTAVVNTSTATSDINKTATQNNQATQDIAAQSTANATRAAAQAAAVPPVQPPLVKTPEQQAMDTPDPGKMFVYDKNTGAKTEIAVNAPLSSNQTMTDILNAGAQDTVDVGNGTTYKQFADGTVSTFSNGVLVGKADPATFAAAKGTQQAQADLESIKHGTYPLTAGQQSQLNDVYNYYQQLIEAQKTINANVTGNETGLQNLYGVGGTGVGISAINKTIADGAAAINKINGEMIDKVNALRSSIQNDQIAVIRDLKGGYDKLVDDKQKEIDKMHDEAKAAQVASQAQVNKTDDSIKSIIDEAAKNGASPEILAQLQKSLDAHDYAGAMQTAAGHLQDPTSDAGQYAAYVQKQKASGKSAMDAGSFLAAKKYQQEYASASAAAAANDAFTTGSAHQSKLESQYRTTLLKTISSRSGELGVQSAKVDSAIHAQSLLDQFKQPDGTYNVPASQYKELVMNVASAIANGMSTTDSSRDALTQATLKGDVNAALTYLTGTPQTGSTQDVIKNLADTIKRQGDTSEDLRNKYVQQLVPPTDLSQDRVDALYNKTIPNLPSYTKMSNGDPAYMTPDQLNSTALNSLDKFTAQDPKNQQMIDAIYAAHPNDSPISIAQNLGLMPKP